MDVTSLYGLKIFAYGGTGQLSLIDRESGEVFAIALRDGFQDMTNYQPLLAAFDAELASCIVNNVAVGERRLVDQRGEDYAKTAAVPTYTPSEAVRFERMVADVARKIHMEESAKIELRTRRAAEAAAHIAPRDLEPRLEAIRPAVDPVDPVILNQAEVEAATPATSEAV